MICRIIKCFFHCIEATLEHSTINYENRLIHVPLVYQNMAGKRFKNSSEWMLLARFEKN